MWDTSVTWSGTQNTWNASVAESTLMYFVLPQDMKESEIRCTVISAR